MHWVTFDVKGNVNVNGKRKSQTEKNVNVTSNFSNVKMKIAIKCDVKYFYSLVPFRIVSVQKDFK